MVKRKFWTKKITSELRVLSRFAVACRSFLQFSSPLANYAVLYFHSTIKTMVFFKEYLNVIKQFDSSVFCCCQIRICIPSCSLSSSVVHKQLYVFSISHNLLPCICLSNF